MPLGRLPPTEQQGGRPSSSVAFAGFPGEAKDKIRNFLNKESVSSIARESDLVTPASIPTVFPRPQLTTTSNDTAQGLETSRCGQSNS